MPLRGPVVRREARKERPPRALHDRATVKQTISVARDARGVSDAARVRGGEESSAFRCGRGSITKRTAVPCFFFIGLILLERRRRPCQPRCTSLQLRSARCLLLLLGSPCWLLLLICNRDITFCLWRKESEAKRSRRVPEDAMAAPKAPLPLKEALGLQPS